METAEKKIKMQTKIINTNGFGNHPKNSDNQNVLKYNNDYKQRLWQLDCFDWGA